MFALFQRLFASSVTDVLHVTSPNGFHLRPAALFVNEAKRFSCRIEAENRGKIVNAKNLNELLSLGLERGDHFDLICTGRDAKEAQAALIACFERLMQEEKPHTPKEAPQPSDTQSESFYEGASLPLTTLVGSVAIAPLWHYRTTIRQTERKRDFSEALSHTLQTLETEARTHKRTTEASIYRAQHALLHSLAEDVETLQAFEAKIAQSMEALEGSILSAKRDDFRDILFRIKKAMGEEHDVTYPKHPFILVADDLLPSQIATLSQTAVAGVILQKSSPFSHTAILLKEHPFPSALLSEEIPDEVSEEVILDTVHAQLVHKPTPNDLQRAEETEKKIRTQTDTMQEQRFAPATTQDGERIFVYANVTDVASAKEAKSAGAEGIGLLRTEFLFKEHLPSHQVQVDAYSEIFGLFDDVTVRTLDVGGDKALPYIDLPKESNPFLGVRGIRLLETHPDLIEAQLRAIFEAADGRAVKVMFPMISTPEEFSKAKDFAMQTAQKYGLSISSIRFGMMIEVPSVLFMLDAFDAIVDFYSIGSNDLTQYLYAIERTHPTLQPPLDTPALFHAVAHITAHCNKPVSLCGEIAGDPTHTAALIQSKIRTLSLSPARIARIKEAIRSI